MCVSKKNQDHLTGYEWTSRTAHRNHSSTGGHQRSFREKFIGGRGTAKKIRVCVRVHVSWNVLHDYVCSFYWHLSWFWAVFVGKCPVCFYACSLLSFSLAALSLLSVFCRFLSSLSLVPLCVLSLFVVSRAANKHTWTPNNADVHVLKLRALHLTSFLYVFSPTRCHGSRGYSSKVRCRGAPSKSVLIERKMSGPLMA